MDRPIIILHVVQLERQFWEMWLRYLVIMVDGAAMVLPGFFLTLHAPKKRGDKV